MYIVGSRETKPAIRGCRPHGARQARPNFPWLELYDAFDPPGATSCSQRWGLPAKANPTSTTMRTTIFVYYEAAWGAGG